jgi:hypothetical protein
MALESVSSQPEQLLFTTLYDFSYLFRSLDELALYEIFVATDFAWFESHDIFSV